MAGDQAVYEAARGGIPEQRAIGVSFRGFQCQIARKIEKRLVMARQTLRQVRACRRLLGGGAGKLARIEGHEDSVKPYRRLRRAVGAGRTDRKRSRRRFMHEGTAADATIEAGMRQLEANEVPSKRSAQMSATLKPHVLDAEPVFARSAARRQRRRRGTVFLRKV